MYSRKIFMFVCRALFVINALIVYGLIYDAWDYVVWDFWTKQLLGISGIFFALFIVSCLLRQSKKEIFEPILAFQLFLLGLPLLLLSYPMLGSISIQLGFAHIIVMLCCTVINLLHYIWALFGKTQSGFQRPVGQGEVGAVDSVAPRNATLQLIVDLSNKVSKVVVVLLSAITLAATVIFFIKPGSLKEDLRKIDTYYQADTFANYYRRFLKSDYWDFYFYLYNVGGLKYDRSDKDLIELRYNYYLYKILTVEPFKGGSVERYEKLFMIAPRAKERLKVLYEDDSAHYRQREAAGYALRRALGNEAEDYFGKFLDSKSIFLVEESICRLADLKSVKFRDKIAEIRRSRAKGTTGVFRGFFCDINSGKNNELFGEP